MVAPRSVSVTVRPLSERVWELHASETITGTIDKSLIAAQRDAPKLRRPIEMVTNAILQ